MPAQYAHYRFGTEALPMLPTKLRQQLERLRPLFDVGLQGPDPFFYYNPLRKTAMGALGHTFHRQSGKVFFGSAVKKLRSAPTEGGKAYIFGVLGHYSLDSLCHPVICGIHDAGDINHTELETEFDRFLLASDGIEKPERYDMTDHFRLTRGQCAVMSRFYPPATARTVERALRNMVLVNRMLTIRNRELARKLMGYGGRTASFMVMPDAPNSHCAHLDEKLMELYTRALERYPVLAEQLLASIANGTPLGEDFAPDFG